MINKIKKLALVASTAFLLFAPALVPSIASADSCSSHIASQVALGANDAAGSGSTIDCTATSSGDTIQTLASKVVDIFSIIVGATAVIMIIYSGFRYITSGGSSDRVGGAKNSLIYAIIGLVIVAVAQLIVHYVLNTASGAGGLGS